MTEDEMRARFHQNRDEAEAIRRKGAPLRAKYDELQEKIDALVAEQKALGRRIREADMPLVELDREAAMLVRALGGKTGPRPA